MSDRDGREKRDGDETGVDNAGTVRSAQAVAGSQMRDPTVTIARSRQQVAQRTIERSIRMRKTQGNFNHLKDV
jgi:hypothetical protein